VWFLWGKNRILQYCLDDEGFEESEIMLREKCKLSYRYICFVIFKRLTKICYDESLDRQLYFLEARRGAARIGNGTKRSACRLGADYKQLWQTGS
jgi:hypothetical protein